MLGSKQLRGKTTILNAGISKQVLRKPPGAPGRVRVPLGPQQGQGSTRAPGRVRVVYGQVDQVRLGKVRISKSPFSKKKFEILAFEMSAGAQLSVSSLTRFYFIFPH